MLELYGITFLVALLCGVAIQIKRARREREQRPPLPLLPEEKCCTFCEKSRPKVRFLIGGPTLPFADGGGVEIYVCDECIPHLEAVIAAPQEQPPTPRPDGGPFCSFCRKGRAGVERMVLGARYHRVTAEDGTSEVHRVVRHQLFASRYGDRATLLAELYICNECIVLTRQISDERARRAS